MASKLKSHGSHQVGGAERGGSEYHVVKRVSSDAALCTCTSDFNGCASECFSRWVDVKKRGVEPLMHV